MLTYNNKAPIKMKIRVKRYALFFVEITIKNFVWCSEIVLYGKS